MCGGCGSVRNCNTVSNRCGCSCNCSNGQPGIQGPPGIPGANGFVSSQKGIVAQILGGQGMSTSLVAVKNRVDSVPTTNASVHFYKAVGNTGQEVSNYDIITNNDMVVYPYFGDRFLGASGLMAINAPYTVPFGTTLKVFCYNEEDGVWTIF